MPPQTGKGGRRVLVDSNAAEPYDEVRVALSEDVVVDQVSLTTGDAIIVGRYLTFVVERKFTPDLLNSLVGRQRNGRSRLWNQCQRLRKLFCPGDGDGHGALLPLLLWHGPMIRERDGKVVYYAGNHTRTTGVPFWAVHNALLMIQFSGVPVWYVGGAPYAECLARLLALADKPLHRYAEIFNPTRLASLEALPLVM